MCVILIKGCNSCVQAALLEKLAEQVGMESLMRKSIYCMAYIVVVLLQYVIR